MRNDPPTTPCGISPSSPVNPDAPPVKRISALGLGRSSWAITGREQKNVSAVIVVRQFRVRFTGCISCGKVNWKAPRRIATVVPLQTFNQITNSWRSEKTMATIKVLQAKDVDAQISRTCSLIDFGLCPFRDLPKFS